MVISNPRGRSVSWILMTSTDALAQGATKYVHVMDGSTITTENYSSRIPVPRNGTLEGFEVVASGSPGGGQTYTLTVRVNGVTKLSVVIADGDTVGFDRTSSVDVVVGDDVSFKMVSSVGATTNRYFGMALGLYS